MIKSTERVAFVLNVKSCCGCKTCQIACLDGHDLKEFSLLRRVYEITKGKWEKTNGGQYINFDISTRYLSLSCNHCQNAPCQKICPEKALLRGPYGTVIVQEDRCVGCGKCIPTCPYEAIKFISETKKVIKCDFCFDRLNEGLKPLCVEACPMGALNFEKYDLLLGMDNMAMPNSIFLPDWPNTEPSLFLSNINTKNIISFSAKLIDNPEEV
jgi:anaerobic dimethyl sulfoxide reductase subunit B (iron-sulfur subunit)